MKQNWFLSIIACLLSLSLPVIAAPKATRIEFAKGSYCGSYTGDFSGGRRFILSLGRNQTFVSRNTAGDDQIDLYVQGPTGKIPGKKITEDEVHYQTTAKGDYEILVVSSAKFSAIEFCAY